MAYEEDEQLDQVETQRRGWMFRGTDLSKVPCFRDSFMYSIGSGMVVGIAYNLLTSKRPYNLAFGTYTVVLFGYWGVCRYNHRMNEDMRRKFDTFRKLKYRGELANTGAEAGSE